MNKKQFVEKLGQLRPSATFLTVLGYRNAYSEIADYSLIFHMSYEKALERSLDLLKDFSPADDVQATAKSELMTSFSKSLDKVHLDPEGELDGTYSACHDREGRIIKGLKLHKESGALHLYGLVNMKRIHMPGLYGEDTRRYPTMVKDRIRALTPVGKFRQFKMLPHCVTRITVENLSLVPPSR